MRLAFAALAALVAFSGCYVEIEEEVGSDAAEFGTECPDEFSPGDACALDPAVRCAIVNQFSSCASTVCMCLGGRFSCIEGLGAQDGEPCADSPLTSCEYEGTPSCDVPPTGAGCSCNSDGTWRCFCSCYGPDTTCPIETDPSGCPLRYFLGLEGTRCDLAIADCSYPEGICTCVDDGSGQGVFECFRE